VRSRTPTSASAASFLAIPIWPRTAALKNQQFKLTSHRGGLIALCGRVTRGDAGCCGGDQVPQM
jgi:hypothetical protein